MYWLLPITVFLTHFHILDNELVGNHAWRQCETASTIMNYYEGGMDFVHPRVNHLDYPNGLKRMELPLFQYSAAGLYHIFGPYVTVLRLFCFVIGLFSIFGMRSLAQRTFMSKRAGWIGAWTLAWSPLFYYYLVNPMPDVLALCFGIWSLAFYVRWHQERVYSHVLFSAGLLALATLCKLPFITFISLPVAHLIWQSTKAKRLYFKELLVYALAIPAGTWWYLLFFEEWRHNGVVDGIFSTTSKDLPRLALILYDNIIPTLPELILNYAATGFFLTGVWFLFRNNTRNHPLWIAFAGLGAGVGAYFIYEMNMIAFSHDYYLFPFLPGLFMIVTYGVKQWSAASISWVKTATVVVLAVLPITAALRINHRWDKEHKEIIVHKEALQQAVPDTALCMVGHDLSPHIYLYHLHKKGWSLNKDFIVKVKLDKWLDQGAEYLYCDDRSIEKNPLVAPLLVEKITTIGSFNVWKLNNPKIGDNGK